MSHEGYLPKALAPLTAIKCRYLEVVNPLLSRRLLVLARTFPDELRMYGRAFSAIVDRQSRTIPHARHASLPEASDYLGYEGVVGAVVAELLSPGIGSVLGEEAAMTLLVTIASPAHSPATLSSLVVDAMKVARRRPALASRLPADAALPGTGAADGHEDRFQGDHRHPAFALLDATPAPSAGVAPEGLRRASGACAPASEGAAPTSDAQLPPPTCASRRRALVEGHPRRVAELVAGQGRGRPRCAWTSPACTLSP